MVCSNSVLVNVFYKCYISSVDSGGVLVGESVTLRSPTSRARAFLALQATAKTAPIPKGTAYPMSKTGGPLYCLVPVGSSTGVGRQAE